jgi:formylmethanofuran dehydrogenase subunit E
MQAYRVLPPGELFRTEWVEVRLLPQDLPGYKGPRVVCAECGERINFGREVERGGRTLCRSCAGQRYYDPLPHH